MIIKLVSGDKLYINCDYDEFLKGFLEITKGNPNLQYITINDYVLFTSNIEYITRD